jgi:hypothetical protein
MFSDDSDGGAPPPKLARDAHSVDCGITEQNQKGFSHNHGKKQ